MKKLIVEKRNAFTVLGGSLSVLAVLVSLDVVYKYNLFIEKITPVLLGTSLFYIINSVLFLFFFNNSIVGKWIKLSWKVLIFTLPFYLIYNNTYERCDILCDIVLYPAFVIYFVFTIATPFYLIKQKTNFKNAK